MNRRIIAGIAVITGLAAIGALVCAGMDKEENKESELSTKLNTVALFLVPLLPEPLNRAFHCLPESLQIVNRIERAGFLAVSAASGSLRFTFDSQALYARGLSPGDVVNAVDLQNLLLPSVPESPKILYAPAVGKNPVGLCVPLLG